MRFNEEPASPSCETQEPAGWRPNDELNYPVRELPREIPRMEKHAYISEFTVKNRVNHIMLKLDAQSRI